MKKSWIISLVLIISLILTNLFFIVLISAEIRINEVELNPYGSDSGNEWIELYSNNDLNLTGWILKNNDDDQIINLTQNIIGYLIISLEGQWLDNSDEKIFLYNQNELIDETILFSDSNNDDKTWQYCNSFWKFNDMTKDSDNNCEETQDNPSQNNTQNPIENNNPSTKTPISLNIDWDDDEIINGNEFNIKIKAKNLEDKNYNFKIWIENEEGRIISDRYGEDSSEKRIWKSGNYYIYNLFEGPGTQTETIKIRIREDYKDFSGDAEIFFKIEGEEEDYEDIEILEKEEKTEEIKKNISEETKITTKSSDSVTSISGEVIRIGSSEYKENIIYESGNEKSKVYVLIGFVILCLIIILFVFKNL